MLYNLEQSNFTQFTIDVEFYVGQYYYIKVHGILCTVFYEIIQATSGQRDDRI